MNEEKQLWAVEVIGPDDWFAARSLQDAREYATRLNAAFMRRPADKMEPNIWAIPRAVTWGKAHHDESLALRDHSEGEWSKPALSTGRAGHSDAAQVSPDHNISANGENRLSGEKNG